MLCKRIIISILLITGINFSLQAQMFERSKHFDKSFAVSKTTQLTITNKYGNIHLVEWNKDSVRFEVELRVADPKPQRVDKLFSEIDVVFNNSPYYVNATTTFSGSGSLWNELSDMTKTVMNTGNAASIQYTVYLPSYLKVKIDNRFGNIYTTDHQNNTEFRLSNGSLQANNLGGRSQIVIEFGNASINHIDDGRIELNYSEMDLATAEKLSLTGRSSTVEIADVKQINLDSRRDKITIEKLSSISGSTSFSRLTIKELNTDCMLTSSYGSLQLLEPSSELGFLQLKSDFTVTNIYAQPSTDAEVEVTSARNAKINMPPSMSDVEKQNLTTQPEAQFFKGKLGKGSRSNWKFDVSGGELNIFIKH